MPFWFKISLKDYINAEHYFRIFVRCRYAYIDCPCSCIQDLLFLSEDISSCLLHWVLAIKPKQGRTEFGTTRKQLICKTPAAISLCAANIQCLTLVSIQQEKSSSLHHLSFLQLAISWPRVYKENGNERRAWGCAFPSCLQGLATSRQVWNVTLFAVSCCFAIPKTCPLWQLRLPAPLAAWECCSPRRPDYIHSYIPTSYGFSCFREEVPCISKSIIWLCGLRSS